MRRYVLMTVAAGASLVLATRASALPPGAAIEMHRAGSIDYMSGGVGEQERASMRSVGNDYNLKLVTTLPSGAYVSDVDLTIADANGTPLLNTKTEGPLFYAKLPDGQYRIIARANGQTVQRTVRPGGAEVALSFNAPSAASGPAPMYYGRTDSPQPTPAEKQGLISLYNLDPSSANVRAQVNQYEVYPDGTTRPIPPGAVRAPSAPEEAGGITIHIEPVPEPGAVPPPAVVSPDGQL